MKSRLDTIEYRLQEFIEKTIFFFPWNNRQTLFAHLLVDAVARTLMEDAAGRISLANDYVIVGNPDLILPWQNNPIFSSDLSKFLVEAAADVGMTFHSTPAFQLIADPSLPSGAFRIEPVEVDQIIEETGVMSVNGQETKPAGTLPPNAFLILYGSEIYPLRLSVVNIGRRLENNLVIDDPRVSRNHALLRANNGRYMLCDLNSSGGTYVNGLRITQQALRPGDVISLAGVSIIYGEESGSDPYSTDGSTTAITPPPSHKP
jgi:hypothetical protein